MSGSEVSALAPTKPRRRGPSKKLRAALAAEREAGFNIENRLLLQETAPKAAGRAA